MTGLLLRSVALAIAVAAFVDPPLGLTARERPRIAVTLQRSDDARSVGVRDRLVRDLRSEFDVVSGPDRDAPAAIVIGDRYPERPAGFSQRTSTVTIDAVHREAAAHIAAVRAARAVPRGTRIQLEVDLHAIGVNGSTSAVTVSAGAAGRPDIEVARASHPWAAGAEHVSLRLDAMPLDLPPWHLRVRLAEAGRPSTVETSDVIVEEAFPLRVLFYEPRPSWMATFVRRALERDGRFVVSGLDYPSRGIRISSGDVASLDHSTLRQFRAVIVGGLDRLTVGDRDLLDRFARERGGSLVLLPDAHPGGGPSSEWIPSAGIREVLLERPAVLSVVAPLPAIQASELLTFSGATVPGAKVPGATVLARLTGSNEAVITMEPHGAGRLLVSGALDAWRYRAENDASFDRFWQSAIAGVALATPQPIDVEITPAIARPGEATRIVARIHRAVFAATGPLQVSARLDTGEPLRLWPEAEVDVFTGSFVPSRTAPQRVTVSATIGEARVATGSAFVAIDPAARRAEPIVPLAMLAASRGGIDVPPERLANLESYLRREVTPSRVQSATHPMRSGWWMVPFAACLGGEWWLRRKRGLR